MHVSLFKNVTEVVHAGGLHTIILLQHGDMRIANISTCTCMHVHPWAAQRFEKWSRKFKTVTVSSSCACAIITRPLCAKGVVLIHHIM